MKVTSCTWYIVAGTMKADFNRFNIRIYSKKKKDHKFFEKVFLTEIIKDVKVERCMISDIFYK